MVSEETLARLWWHAALPWDAVPGVRRYEGVVPAIADATRRGRGSIEEVQRAFDDFLKTLSVLNHELNGPTPSERKEPGPDPLPGRLVHAVSDAILLLAEWEEFAKRAGKVVPPFAWRAQSAWCAIVDGDIDDIEEHVSWEEAALFD